MVKSCVWAGHSPVALLAEGVDRNLVEQIKRGKQGGSPSSRRAWIEIFFDYVEGSATARSPSSRRAWIEIDSLRAYALSPLGSPSSRRAWIEIK